MVFFKDLDGGWIINILKVIYWIKNVSSVCNLVLGRFNLNCKLKVSLGFIMKFLFLKKKWVG